MTRNLSGRVALYKQGEASLVLEQPIDRLQTALSQFPQYQPETEHHFHGGMYIREVWRPAGALVVGKVHKREHFYMVVVGRVQITTDEGVRDIVGPEILLCRPGTKRAVYAVTGAMCMTVHRTDAKTVEEAEAELVEEDASSMYAAGNQVKQEVLP